MFLQFGHGERRECQRTTRQLPVDTMLSTTPRAILSPGRFAPSATSRIWYWADVGPAFSRLASDAVWWADHTVTKSPHQPGASMRMYTVNLLVGVRDIGPPARPGRGTGLDVGQYSPIAWRNSRQD